MARQYKESAIGMEITEDNIYLAQVDLIDDLPTVTKVKAIAIPPRSLMNNQIADTTLIAEQLHSTFEEESFASDNIVIAVNSTHFLKRHAKVPVANRQEMLMELELSVSKQTDFLQQEFLMGAQFYQEPLSGDDEQAGREFQWESVLYAALSQDSISDLEDLALQLNKSLVAVDLVPLAAMRAMMAQGRYKNKSAVLLYVDTHYIDINIVRDDQILLSHVLKRSLSDVVQEDFLLDATVTELKQFFLQYSNLFPHYDLPTDLVYTTRHLDSDPFLERCGSELGLQCKAYRLGDNVGLPDIELTEGKHLQYTRNNLPAVGLALKYFEPINKTLSITKVKKQLSPIFEKKQLVLFSLGLLLSLGLAFAVHIYFSGLSASVDSKLLATKAEIKDIQSGEFVGRQKKVRVLRERIRYLGQLNGQSQSKYAFFQQLLGDLPSDMWFSSLSMNKKRDSQSVSIQGRAYFQESIYTFYNSLRQRYVDVNLVTIKTQYDSDGVGIHSFTVNFIWREP